jgi:hypothetical protein
MNDIENDEFYILRQYAYHCPIIVLTGSSSPIKGNMIQLGARAVLERELHLTAGSFLILSAKTRFSVLLITDTVNSVPIL